MPPAGLQEKSHPQNPTPARSPKSYLISARRSLLGPLGRCPKSQTLLGYCPDESAYVIAELPCQNWSCRTCAERKIRRLAVMTRAAKPSRMFTLTVNPAHWENPRQAFDGTRRQVSELIKKLRARFGELEYLRVTELTKQGWPHYHLLVRSGYIPHAAVKKLWEEMTGAYIVDVRQVKQCFRAYTYLVKYLSKLHKIEWTARHVSYSKGFFPKVDKPESPTASVENRSILQMHPITYLLQNHKGDTLEDYLGRTYLIRESFTNDDF